MASVRSCRLSGRSARPWRPPVRPLTPWRLKPRPTDGILADVTQGSSVKRPWIRFYQGLGLGLTWNAHPWNVPGLNELFNESGDLYSTDDRWLQLKNELGIRVLEIEVEWWSGADEPERVEVKRERATVTVLVYRDNERSRAPGDPLEFARAEVQAIYEVVRRALTD